MRMLLQWAKEMNANYVRLAHYPHSEEMVRLADEMGLLVWAEVPVYWTISWTNPATFDNANAQLSDLMKRDRNRASVIVWSIGNETPGQRAAQCLHGQAGRHRPRAGRYPPGRGRARGAPERSEVVVEDPLADQLDLASFNEYAGWYWSNNRDMLNFRFNIRYRKPVVITEFGADALGGYHADADTRWSEEYQQRLYENQIKMLGAIPGLRGMSPVEIRPDSARRAPARIRSEVAGDRRASCRAGRDGASILIWFSYSRCWYSSLQRVSASAW